MALYHVSDNPDIVLFEPRPVKREDLCLPPVIWAIDEEHLPNYMLPRDCPRVCYRLRDTANTEERATYFCCRESLHAISIEHRWLERAYSATLYLYTFDHADFSLQDEHAGYYVSHTAQKPIERREIPNILLELTRRSVEIHVLPQLWDLAESIKKTSFDWSLIRMRNALPPDA